MRRRLLLNNTRSGDWYETDGLKIHYDGIDNTGFGHSDHTDIWFNLADPYGCHGVPASAINNIITSRWGTNRLDCTASNSVITTMSKTTYTAWTIEMVFSISALQSSEQQLFSNIEAGGYELMLSSTGLPRVRVYKGGSYRVSGDSNPVVVDNIYSISGTWDGEVLSFYNGGVLIDTNTYSTGSTKEPDTVFALFANPKGWGTLSNTTYGYIYALRYYNRALNASEVAYNYGLDDSRFNITTTNASLIQNNE